MKTIARLTAPAFLLGLLSAPAHAGVTLDQSPLTVQKKVAPNLLYILDDSGSMTWTFMPDSAHTGDIRERSPDVNGVYYNPDFIYAPPPKADGTFYPNSSFTAAWIDGFDTSIGTINILADPEVRDRICLDQGFLICWDWGDYFFEYYRYKGGSGCSTPAGENNPNCYTRYAVSTSCTAEMPNCSDDPATLTNVANWYSYYRTRLNAAKSATMRAFSGMDPEFRFGYAAINSDTPSINNSRTQVTPFGDGSSGTRKAEFWSWLQNKDADGGTPLRTALNLAGKYYSNAQPWEDDAGDELTCRQSFTILTTDGYWNDDFTGVGNADGVDGKTYTNPSGKSGGYKAAPPFSDGYSNTLADIAMQYWKTDLRPALANDVPSSQADPAFWQHMSTFAVSLGAKLTGIEPEGTTVEQIIQWGWYGGEPINGFAWPPPSSDSENNIADLAHAGINGRGGFYAASNPEQFANALQDALARVSERLGSGASLSANATRLDQGSITYQASYTTEQWTGDLAAFKLDPDTGEINDTALWRAKDKLPAPDSRNIYTYNPATGEFVEFTWDNLSDTQKAALDQDPNLVNYLRGDSSQEIKNGGAFRNRSSVLGDIINSQPVYVGAPDPVLFTGKSFTGADKYSSFASSMSTRAKVIYVAANDGYLHGFNAETGEETFAYLPGHAINADLRSLADPRYTHKYIHDGELTVADAYFDGAWHTVLVGTTGRAQAKVVYALDVTNPSKVELLWERAAADGMDGSAFIGNVIGKPSIAQTEDGEWSVLMGNGYNSAEDTAALLQFDLASGELTVYETDAETSNGLAAPGIWDEGNDGIMDFAYAGDRLGRLWKFTLNKPKQTAHLFTAVNDDNKTQPITAGILLGKSPDSNRVWAFFGTGQYLNSDDLTDKTVQSWYGLIVDGDNQLVKNLEEGRSFLVKRWIASEVGTGMTEMSARTVSPGAEGDLIGKSGWYMDLVSPVRGEEGERMILTNQYHGNLLLGTTLIPVATDVCNPSGRGWIMAIDPFTGRPPANVFFDVTGDGIVDENDKIAGAIPAGIGFNAIPNAPIFVGNLMLISLETGVIQKIETNPSGGARGRVSWREIINP